jgi:hypothetical protein
MGELLKATERAKGTRGAGRPKLGTNQREVPKNAPTLAELGVTLKESMEARQDRAGGKSLFRPGIDF